MQEAWVCEARQVEAGEGGFYSMLILIAISINAEELLSERHLLQQLWKRLFLKVQFASSS
jgi:hypothetical protein